ncbi:hypothetical protein GGG16DRAFT_55520, partial [Schizophyllum commune]
MRANAGGKTALILSGKDVNSQDSRNTGKLSPQDAGLDAKSKDLDSRSEAHCQAPAQGDCLCANAGGQTVVLSRNGIKVRHAHSAEEHASQLFAYGAAAKTSGPSSSLGSDSPKGSGSADSAALLPSLAHISPDSPRSSSCEMKAQDLRDIDDQAVQKVEAQSSSTSRGHILCPSRDDAEAAAPPAPSLTVREIRPSGTRAAEAVNSDEYITKDCKQRQKRGEGVSCESAADARDLMSVALPRRFGEKPTSPGASAAGHVTVGLRAEVSSRSSRDSRGHSARSTKHICDESPTQFADLNSQRHAQRASADGVSPSPSTASRNHAARKPPDKMTSNGLGPCQSTPHLHCASVLSAVPVLRSSRQPASGSGPDSANGRAREWPAVLMQREIDPREGGERTTAPSRKGFDFSIALYGREHSSRSDVAYVTAERAYRARSHSTKQGRASGLQEDGAGGLKRVHAGGQTAVSSRNDVKLRHAHSAEEHAPQLFSCNAAAHPEPVSSSSAGTSLALSPAPTGSDVARGSDSRKDSGLMSSVTPTFSPAHVSPDLSCALSRETNARNLRGVDILAIQEAQVRPGSECRGQVLAPSRADAQATAPCAPLAARAINALGARAAEAAIPDAGERTAVSPCQGINLCDARNRREHSPRSAEAKRDRDEDPAQFPDSIGQCRPPRASAGGLSSSPSIASHYHVAHEPPDETTSDGSSLCGSRSTLLSHFATVPSAAPLPSSPSSATPRILGARKPPDKTSVRSSANSCQPARRSRPASVLSSIPLPRSSRRPRGASKPNSAHWRVRERPVALKSPLREIGVNSWGAQNREWLSPRLDVADTAAPSTSRLHFRASECGRVPKPLEDGASEMKRAHAGGQTVFSFWKDVKPLDARGGNQDPPQFTASDMACSSRASGLDTLNLVSPPSPPSNSRDIRILHAEKLPRVALSSSADVPNASALGCATCPDTMLRLKGKVSLTDKSRRCVAGYVQRLYDDPGGPAYVASSGDGHPSDAYGASSPSRLLVCRSLRQSVVRAEKSRTPTTVDGHVSFEFPVAFALVNSRSAGRDMSAQLAVRSQIGGEACKGPLGNISAFPMKDKNTSSQSQDKRADSIAFSKDARDLPRPSGIAMCSSWGLSVLCIECRLLKSCGISPESMQSTTEQTHQIVSLGGTRLRYPQWKMHADTRRVKPGTWGPTGCRAQDTGSANLQGGLRRESSHRCRIYTLLKYRGLCKLSRISNPSRTTQDNSPREIRRASCAGGLLARLARVPFLPFSPISTMDLRCLFAGQDIPAALAHKSQQIPLRAQALTDARQSRPAPERLLDLHRYPSRSSELDA